jgi:hypothetical protein
MDFKTRGRLSWLAYLIYTLKNRGLVRTCAMGYREWRKERELGIRTLGIKRPQFCGTQMHEESGGHLYQPSSSVLFKKAMEALPFRPEGKRFLDVGSGKGRAMILAAEEGFADVVGIEYAAELIDQAHVNIEKVRGKFPETVFRMAEGNAIEFGLPEGTDVAYLFNPFDAETLDRWIATILPQVRKPLHIVYMHPVFHPILERQDPKMEKVFSDAQGEFIIYRLAPSIPSTPQDAEG